MFDAVSASQSDAVLVGVPKFVVKQLGPDLLEEFTAQMCHNFAGHLQTLACQEVF
jgi:hypothetical protein